ncbi:MAG: hypothetical protein IKE62_03445 [Oscillospiraceae bacterium]|nr:hypothetical protein [Oscillospiraceae bacterium]
MKKILSVVLALVLVAGLSAAALAAVDTSTWTFTPTDTDVVTFKVTYDSDIVPKETLSFTSTPADDNPDSTNVTIDDVTVSGKSNDVTVKLPSYSKVGKYVYTIKMVEGDTQGVTYSKESISITVQIVYDYENSCLKVFEAGITKDESGNKNDTLANTYEYLPEDVGALTVKKVVKGEYGRKDKLFDIKVTITTETDLKVWSDITVSGGSDAGNTQTIAGDGWTGSKEINIKLADDETVSIKNLPAGVTYKVEEDAKHLSGDINSDEGYTATYENDEGTIAKDTPVAAVVTNTKDSVIETGIALDSLPYIVIGGAVLLAAVAVLLRKRRYEED